MTAEKHAFSLTCVLLVLCILLSCCIGFFLTHGDVAYRIWLRMRRYPDPNLEAVDLTGNLREWSLEELKAQDSVTFSNLLTLVNTAHPLPQDYEAILTEYNGAQMHPDMVFAYVALRDKVETRTGMRLYVSDDYRTREEQETILSESGAEVAAKLGCSEHEAGLALDVCVRYFGGESFLKTRAGRVVGEICADYGYVIRYPLGKEDITGCAYEPWHLRYVGAPHAKIMTESGLTLEEYLAWLLPNTWYESGEYLISRQTNEQILLPIAWSSCEISPDNMGGYVVTVKK